LAVSSMLKIQLLGHNSVKEEVKRFLRELGVVEVTEVDVPDDSGPESGPRSVREDDDFKDKLEMLNSAISFLEDYQEKKSLFSGLAEGPILVSDDEIKAIIKENPAQVVYAECRDIEGLISRNRNRLSRSRELVSKLSEWKGLGVPLDRMSTEGYQVQLWTVPEKDMEEIEKNIEGKCGLYALTRVSKKDGQVHLALIIPEGDPEGAAGIIKERGGTLNDFKGVSGTPKQVIEREEAAWEDLERKIEEAESRARDMSGLIDKLRVMADHYNERSGLNEVESKFYHTESTFILEGWIREEDRGFFQKRIGAKFEAEVAAAFRKPSKDEKPPIHLDNRGLGGPAEFVTTLYGRPLYREADPTPFLAPFFIFFFAMCLTDAGYGLSLAALSAFILLKFRPSGGAAKLMRLLFIGGIVTAVVGVLAGGIFGLGPDSIPAIRKFVFVNPLDEPMKVLNISFLLGLLHMIFGMGISMVQKIGRGRLADAVFDNLFWILFLIFLAPLGYSAILGGKLPPQITFWAVRGAVVLAVLIFITGGRKKDSLIMKVLGGLVGFYDVVGYFGDVLSYARLLALGLATSAIAIAVNDIAKMVTGMPMFVGYLFAGFILIAGHAFNLAVNTLGGFVHSARLQYLEFFSKFFAGGGKPFRPFSAERRYSRLKENEAD